MDKEIALNIIKQLDSDTLAEYIIELYDCIKKSKKDFDIEFLKKEYDCDTWINRATDELGETGMNFAYFVAGFRCCETLS